MVNNTGQRLLVVTEQDGEILFGIKQGESLNVRSVKQTKNDKYFSNTIKVNIKGTFVKVMDREDEVIEMLKKYPSTYLAINIMKKYLVKEYNVLLKDNKKYKAVDLSRDMGISRQSAGVHIAKLKELNILGEIDTNKGRLFCINPYYYLRGEKASEQVAKVFDKNSKKPKGVDLVPNGEDL